MTTQHPMVFFGAALPTQIDGGIAGAALTGADIAA